MQGSLNRNDVAGSQRQGPRTNDFGVIVCIKGAVHTTKRLYNYCRLHVRATESLRGRSETDRWKLEVASLGRMISFLGPSVVG